MAHTFRNTDDQDRRIRARSDREFRRSRRGRTITTPEKDNADH